MLQRRDDVQLCLRTGVAGIDVVERPETGLAQQRLRLLDLHLATDTRHAQRPLRSGLADHHAVDSERVDKVARPRLADL